MVPSFTGTTWLDELSEDLESEAVLAVLEGRDPDEAVSDYLDGEAREVPASCLESPKSKRSKR